jgi:hypothetical protein
MVVFEAPLNPRDFTGEGSVITLSGVCCLPHLYGAKRSGLIHSPPFLVLKKTDCRTKKATKTETHLRVNAFVARIADSSFFDAMFGSFCRQRVGICSQLVTLRA